MWRDGATKQAIVAFVERVTGADGNAPVPIEERLAVFDNDGTLWVEKPMLNQLDFILRRLREMAEAVASLRERQPWRAAYTKEYGWLGEVPRSCRPWDARAGVDWPEEDGVQTMCQGEHNGSRQRQVDRHGG